jgi:phosphohistidine phosphatase
MRVLLVRHAAATDRDPARWPNDEIRPLTDKGAQQFGAAARGLAWHAPKPKLVLSSPLVRARQTAAILSKVAGWPAAAKGAALAPDSDPAAVFGELAKLDGDATAAMVGHEPDLGSFVSLCVGGGAFAFKKGGAALVEFDDDPEPGEGALRWFMPPKLLRSLGALARPG